MDVLGRHGCSQNEKKRCLFSEGGVLGTLVSCVNVSKTTCVFVHIRTIATSVVATLLNINLCIQRCYNRRIN